MDFKKLATKRYSVRQFSKKPVEQDKIQSLLDVCGLAPTAHNNQPQRILVISEPNTLEKLKKCTKCHYNAPLAMLVCYDETIAWQRQEDGHISGEVDASIVGTHLIMHAIELGLGSCWVMAFNPDAIIQQFHLPKNIVPVALFPLGYPSKLALPSHYHLMRHSIKKFVKFQSFADKPHFDGQ